MASIEFKKTTRNVQGFLRPAFRTGAWSFQPTCPWSKQVPGPKPSPGIGTPISLKKVMVGMNKFEQRSDIHIIFIPTA